MTTKPRILMVDDNPSDVAVMETMLRDAGLSFDLEVIEDGAEASKRFATPPPGAPWPELVLLDLHMPKKDGREVLHEIKQKENLRDLPVIVLTGDAAPNEIPGFRAYSNTTCLLKPGRLKDYEPIINIIRSVLGRPA